MENGESYKDIEMIFDLMNRNIDDVNIIKKLNIFYLEKGPWSQYLWWKNNLNLYTYHSQEANRLKTEVEAYKINTASLDTIRNGFVELEKMAIRFRGMFVDNVFLVQMGLLNGREAIQSDRIEAYWHLNFLGREAPIGFDKYIGPRE